VDRLREFKARIKMAKIDAGKNDAIQQLAADTKRRMREAMEDDLNTAESMGAMFEMVREVNTLADRGELREDDKAPLLSALDQFDEIFDVLKDEDPGKISKIAKWAESEGKAEAAALVGNTISDEEADRLVGERTAAKKARDFARADAIRAQLSEAGIIVEDTKDGIRWKRK
jgi:cysteinyl-tRNA synthetase